MLFRMGPSKRETIVADTNVSPFARAQHLLPTQKSVSDFVQKHFLSATNVSQFAQFKKHHGQQCVRKMCPRLPGLYEFYGWRTF